MLISLLTLRLEIAKETPQLKFLRPYIATSLDSHLHSGGKTSIKSYASVARGSTAQRDLKVSRSSSFKETGRGEIYQQRRERISSLSESQSHSFQQTSDFSRDKLVILTDQSEEEVLASDIRHSRGEPATNAVCRGQRKLKDIHIELIDDQAFKSLLMASSSERQGLTRQEEEPSTSRGVCHSHQQKEQYPEEVDHQKSHETQSDPDGWSSASQGASANHSASVRMKSHSPTSKMPTTISFHSGNPCVELTKGLLHIYKDSQMTTLDKGVTRSEMLCMLGVPASYTIHDLIKFIAPMGDCVSYMQVLRDAFPNQYMLLIKFRDQTSADDFYSYFNNRPYNSIEPDICHLVYVAKIEVINESEGGSLPLLDMTELPNCPVCLERMEESVDGILTVLCNHAFHTHCLAQWGDTSCPVCRYCQTPEEVADQKCMQCGSHESLWICLICGNVGCGRYVGLHAYKHFQDTNHTYAMQLGTNRVWDYAGDNYVHRLAQNKSDGKLVEVDEGGNEVQEEKLDSITLEYTYLLTTQLESQRLYFMEQISLAVKDVDAKLEESTARWEKERQERERAECKLSEISKEKQVLEKKCSQEIAELRDQLRDVMFYLEAQQKLTNSTGVSQEEIQGSQVIVGAAAAPSHSGKKTRKKR
uniref:BRCA1-associated protein n=1 Tax=Arion vulgaris TaxID=1028688 RepID=A0A0B7A5Q6_9EUPU